MRETGRHDKSEQNEDKAKHTYTYCKNNAPGICTASKRQYLVKK